ncbi:MAG: hypothetical protein HPY87_10295 [Fervidobacterium sp.]|uniref:hypothetical protein n=1 Tax=Fervidobacterium sp. TaxID=1871331 RepID=UPI0025C367B1|nr:hypothetical protein [Fervidobacterium sp.]NPU90248.1 hypothetical protein [Fervidobacterium sp.]
MSNIITKVYKVCRVVDGRYYSYSQNSLSMRYGLGVASVAPVGYIYAVRKRYMADIYACSYRSNEKLAILYCIASIVETKHYPLACAYNDDISLRNFWEKYMEDLKYGTNNMVSEGIILPDSTVLCKWIIPMREIRKRRV